MLFTFSILVQLKRIQACCSIGAVCTNSFLDHTAIRRWTVFKSPGRLCSDNEEPGGHSWTANWRIHLRQLRGNTFHSRNLSTNIDLRWRQGNIAKQRGISIQKVLVILKFHYRLLNKKKKNQKNQKTKKTKKEKRKTKTKRKNFLWWCQKGKSAYDGWSSFWTKSKQNDIFNHLTEAWSLKIRWNNNHSSQYAWTSFASWVANLCKITSEILSVV